MINIYCVIQEIERRTESVGPPKELITTETKVIRDGEELIYYDYLYGQERFKRPINKAYKISIHKSYRENGRVKKKQWSICTIGYYDALEFGLCDCVVYVKLEIKLNEMGLKESEMWDLVYKKFDPIYEQIKADYMLTEEYKVSKRHEGILNRHSNIKYEFDKLYGVGTYNLCYDIYDNLKNEKYLKKLIKKREEEEKEKQKQKQYSSYQERAYSSYNNSSYQTIGQSNYNDEDKVKLKKVYKALAKSFHPDLIKDDGEMMKFVNGLKDDWGI